MTNNYHVNYYKTHRYEIQMKRFIKMAYSRKDTERYYLQRAKKMEHLVKIETYERNKIKAQKSKVIQKVLPRKRKKKKVVKYRIIDNNNDDDYILEF
jgi:hypothetical protein